MVLFDKAVRSSRNTEQDVSWEDFQATVESRGSSAEFHYAVSAAEGRNSVSANAFYVNVTVASGRRTGLEGFAFNVASDSLVDEDGLAVPPSAIAIDLVLPPPTTCLVYLLPGNKPALNFSRAVVLSDPNDLVVSLGNTSANSL